jgi:hypothetical protein
MTSYMAQLRAQPLHNVELSVRAHNVLRNAGYTTLGDLLDVTKAQVLALPHAGVKTWRELSELRECLAYDESESTGTRVAELEAALSRQAANMSFVLNRVSLPLQWFDLLSRELAEDRNILASFERGQS